MWTGDTALDDAVALASPHVVLDPAKRCPRNPPAALLRVFEDTERKPPKAQF
jgi:hypothetical protein